MPMMSSLAAEVDGEGGDRTGSDGFAEAGRASPEEAFHSRADIKALVDACLTPVSTVDSTDFQQSPANVAPASPAIDGSTIKGSSSKNKKTLFSDNEEGVDSSGRIKWSDVISSPSEGAVFSPSRDLNNKAESLHGQGLMMAVDRAKTVSKCGKRCALMLFDVAGLYEAYALAILKACQHLAAASEPVQCFSKNTSTLAKEVTQALVSFAKQTQGLAICIKGSVARPLQSSSSATLETIPTIYNRYTSTRVKSFGARQNANRMRSRYIKSVRDAELAIREFKQVKALELPPEKQEDCNGIESTQSLEAPSDTSTRSSPKASADGPNAPKRKKGRSTWTEIVQKLRLKPGLPSSADKVIKSLNDVQDFENQYCALVEEENLAVARSQTTERMVLEAFQELEEERLYFFLETLSRLLQAERGALNNMSLVLRKFSDDAVADTQLEAKAYSLSPSNAKNKAELVSVAEEIQNLPEDVVGWRNNHKRHLTAKINYTRAVKVLYSFYDELSNATSEFATHLSSRLAAEGYCSQRNAKNSDQLINLLEKHEGTKALSCWTETIRTLEDCSSLAFKLAANLNNDEHFYLDKHLLKADKELKSLTDSEDLRWKQVCDAARNEMKMKLRLDQSIADLEKAKERANFMETDQDMTAANSINPNMSKVLGNMFAILPNGGEEAMAKMLTSDQRRAIVSNNLKDATAKESKDNAAYQDSIDSKQNVVAMYTTAAKNCDKTMSENEEQAWNSVTTVLHGLISSFHNFRNARYENTSRAMAEVVDTLKNGIAKDTTQWTREAQEKLNVQAEHVKVQLIKDAKAKGVGLEEDNHSCFLTVHLEDSKVVYKLLGLVSDEIADGAQTVTEQSRLAISSSDSSQSDFVSLPVEAQSDAGIKFLPRTHTSPPQNSAKDDRGRAPSAATLELISLAETLTESANISLDDKGSSGEVTLPLKGGLKLDSVPALHSNKALNADNEVFLAHFWDGSHDNGDAVPPPLIASYSCAYWTKEGDGFIYPFLHGRMFCTSAKMYFVGWGDKKIMLDWTNVVSVTRETTAMGTVPNALLITYDSGEGEASYFFGSFSYREDAFQMLNRLSTVARSLNELSESQKKCEKVMKPVPPDEILKKMEIMLVNKLKNVSVRRFYELCWSEGVKTNEEPFYKPFVIKMKCHDVSVDDWEFSDEGFVHKWSGEKYAQRRKVRFKFTRTTHLYIGPPVAIVNQTHHCRIEGNDRLVVVITVEMEGIPYADCFAVEIRWVATRVGSNDLQVEAGLVVDFKKSLMLASKIKSGAIKETKPVHEALFEACKEKCSAIVLATPDDGEVKGKETAEPECIIAKAGPHNATTDIERFSFGAKYTEKPWFRYLMVGLGFLILLKMVWILLSPLTTSTQPRAFSESNVEDLMKEINGLRQEMKETRKIIESMNIQLMKLTMEVTT